MGVEAVNWRHPCTDSRTKATNRGNTVKRALPLLRAGAKEYLGGPAAGQLCPGLVADLHKADSYRIQISTPLKKAVKNDTSKRKDEEDEMVSLVRPFHEKGTPH